LKSLQLSKEFISRYKVRGMPTGILHDPRMGKMLCKKVNYAMEPPGRAGSLHKQYRRLERRNTTDTVPV
jgi:hypothetical protein